MPVPAALAATTARQDMPAREPVHNQALPSALGLSPSSGPAYDYDWRSSYGAGPGYSQPPQYNTNLLRSNVEAQQIYYTSGAEGPSY
jgi:hypothetical protein